MTPEVWVLIVGQLLGWSVLVGVGWRSIKHHGDTLDRIEGRIDKLVEQGRSRNGRIGSLERWKARREGEQAGYDEAKEKYQK